MASLLQLRTGMRVKVLLAALPLCALFGTAGCIITETGGSTGSRVDASDVVSIDAGRDPDPDPDPNPDASTVDLPARCALSFADVPADHWARDDIRAIFVHEITDGCNDSPLSYCPDDDTLRKQLAVFLIRALDETPSAAAYNAYFDDVADDSTAGYINRLFELELTSGTGPREFSPNTAVSREQTAVFLVRALGEIPSAAADDAYFDDLVSYHGYVNRLFELNLTTGCGVRVYCPLDATDRDEAAAFVSRGFDLSTDVCAATQ